MANPHGVGVPALLSMRKEGPTRTIPKEPAEDGRDHAHDRVHESCIARPVKK